MSSQKQDEAMQSYRLAWDLEDNGDLAGALQEIDQALELLPDLGVFRVTKGLFLRKMGRLDEAEHILITAVDLNERNHLAWAELALVNESKEWFEKAAFCMEQAVEIKPNVEYYTILANVQLTFDPESALRNANKALELNPDWEEAERVKRRAQQYMREDRG